MRSLRDTGDPCQHAPEVSIVRTDTCSCSRTATSRRLDLPLLLWRRGAGRGGRHTGAGVASRRGGGPGFTTANPERIASLSPALDRQGTRGGGPTLGKPRRRPPNPESGCIPAWKAARFRSEGAPGNIPCTNPPGPPCHGTAMTSFGNTVRKSLSLRVRMPSQRDANAPIKISASGRFGTLAVRRAAT